MFAHKLFSLIDILVKHKIASHSKELGFAFTMRFIYEIKV